MFRILKEHMKKNGWGFCPIALLTGILLLLSAPFSSKAQEEAPPLSSLSTPQSSTESPAEMPSVLPETDSSDFSLMDESLDIDPDTIPSLFFTPEALALLKDAINGLTASGSKDIDKPQKEPGIRELSLGGIVYNGPEQWAVWLNGRRITPEALPEQIFDLKVKDNYIDLKWYDAYTNRIYPVRLRPNERFNMDSRLFLTGTHSEEHKL